MTVNELVAELKKGVSGKYVFYGAEDYLKRFYVGRIRKTVLSGDDTVDSFNHYVIKEEEGDVSDIDAALTSPPMMAERTLVEIYWDVKNSKFGEKVLELMEFAQADFTVVLLVCPDGGFDGGKKNKPSKMLSKTEKFAKVCAFEAQTPAELRRFMARRFSTEGLSVTTQCADFIIQYCGRDMSLLSMELDKMAAAAVSRGMSEVSEELVRDVAIKGSEEEDFALTNAVLSGDRKSALEALREAKNRREPPQLVLGSVSKSMNDMLSVALMMKKGCDKGEIARKLKIHEYKTGLIMTAVKDVEIAKLAAALDRCREADVKLKTTTLEFIALERLICTLPIIKRGRR